MVRSRCPPISKFWLSFSFPPGLFGGLASFGRCRSLLLPLLSPLFVSYVPVLDPLAASMVAMLWSWDSLQAYSFLPFCRDLSGLGVGVSSQSLELSFWLFLDPFLLCS